MIQRALRVLVCLALCLTLAGPAYATESGVEAPVAASGIEVPVTVNGVAIETGFASQVLNGQTYVSYNAIVNALYPDAVAVWANNQAEVTATGLKLCIKPTARYIVANGRYLYVPDGVDMGIELSEDGFPLGLSPEYGRLETGGGVSVQAELPAQFDLRDVNGVSYVSPVKNQYRWSDCWVFATLGSL